MPVSEFAEKFAKNDPTRIIFTRSCPDPTVDLPRAQERYLATCGVRTAEGNLKERPTILDRRLQVLLDTCNEIRLFDFDLDGQGSNLHLAEGDADMIQQYDQPNLWLG